MRQSTFFILIIFLSSACASSTDDQIVFKYANEQPEAALRSQSMLFFKEELEKRTEGKIKVDLFFSGVLGKERELMDLVATGALQGTRGGYYSDANPKYQLFQLPFIIDNWDKALCVVGSNFMARLNEEARANGFHVPATGISQGFRAHTTSDKPIQHPDDLAGLKLRVPSQEVYIQTALAFKANPQEIPYIDVYQAMQTGVVDAQDNAPANIWDFKVYEVSNYLTISNYATGPDPFLVNLSWYEALPDGLKSIFDAVAVDAMALSDRNNREKEQEYIESLSAHLEVNFIEGDDLDPFKEAVKPVYDYFVKQGIITIEDLERVRAITNECP